MHRAHRNALVVAVAGLMLSLGACKPKYPKCESDDHCAEKGEVCVEGQCQECKDNAGCEAKHGAGHECVSGRCEVKPECRAEADCKGGLVCRGQKCVPECQATEDCASGMKCEGQKCVAECAQDVDCGPGRVCKDGACAQPEAKTDNISANCRPMSGSAGEIVAMPAVQFDFNEFNLTVDARNTLSQAADCVKQAGGTIVITIEGHGDERGTQEYNLALGERRANAVKSYLKNLGIDGNRMTTRSMGENEPLCNEQSEECFSRNRRVEFIQQRR
jgi:peptidoglycan-associated lipoprotein